MRIAIATIRVPFIRGGAENHAAGLARAAHAAGHEVDIIALPFQYSPEAHVLRAMDLWQNEDCELFTGGSIDRAICLKFPAYYLRHPAKRVWLLHQHREVYDLFESHFSSASANKVARVLRDEIRRRDTEALSNCGVVFANSVNVANRLRRYNSLESVPLYHPPILAERMHSAPAEPYIFCPSRLEACKRQHLLIEALAHSRTPLAVLLAGEGSQRRSLEARIEQLGVGHRVRFLGRITDEEMVAYYAHALGVYFGPYDEDYGYVTLEAMLAGKPVITCTDSGGPLEFVLDGQTGFVVPPQAEGIGQVIDKLYLRPRWAEELGRAGLDRYRKMNISWDGVLERLLAA